MNGSLRRRSIQSTQSAVRRGGLIGWSIAGLISLELGLVDERGMAQPSMPTQQNPTNTAQLPNLGSSGESSEAEAITRPTLQSGSRGNDVTELQAALKLLGFYSGIVDGVYGQGTIAAVSRFQQSVGLSPDGVVGPATWNRLFPATPDLPPASLPPQVSNNPSPIPSSNSVGGSSTESVDGFPLPSTSAPSSTPPAETSAPSQRPDPQPISPTPVSPTAETRSVPAATDSATLPVLKLGMKGPAVVGLQERLRTIGVFKGTADGVFGPETQMAVKAAQQSFELEPDGVVGPATWRALLSHSR